MMTKVLLNIKGRHRAPGADWESTELMTQGTLYDRNDKTYLVYDEILGEDDTDVSRTRIKIQEDPLLVTVRKTGAIASVMSFGKGVKENSTYKTPYGLFLIGVDTKEVSFEDTEDCLRLHIHYNLEMNYEPLSESDICIEIRARKRVLDWDF